MGIKSDDAKNYDDDVQKSKLFTNVKYQVLL